MAGICERKRRRSFGTAMPGHDDEWNLRMCRPSEDDRAGAASCCGRWQFIWAFALDRNRCAMQVIEVAVRGRSNVARSSLINALTGRNALGAPRIRRGAPGTDLFRRPERGGFGWSICRADGDASAPQRQVASWTTLIHTFLQGRRPGAGSCADRCGGHGIKDVDSDVSDTLAKAASSYQSC